MIDKSDIKQWCDYRPVRIEKHLSNKGDQSLSDAVGELIEQCFNDLQAKPMYETLEEYERILGYKVNESCRTGFNMARLNLPSHEDK